METNPLLKLTAILAIAILFLQLPVGDSLRIPSRASKFARTPNPALWGNPALRHQERNNADEQLSLKTSQNLHNHPYVFAFGGRDGYDRVVDSVSRLDVFTGKWRSYQRTLTARSYTGIAKLGNEVFLCGGKSNEHTYLTSVEVYDLSTETSSYVRSMPYPRDAAAAAALDGFVYVAGGRNSSSSYMSAVLRYDTRTDHWQFVKPMKHGRYGHQLVTIRGALYAIGGYSAGTYVESYDQIADEWSTVTSTNYAHQFFGATVGAGKIWVCSSLGCEVYNPETDRWQVIQKIHGNSGTTLMYADGKLWSMGGYTDSKSTTNLFSYDVHTDKWTKERDMDTPRSYHASVMENH